LGFLVLFSGLCTIFALVVTAAQAWQEHAQARWPEVTAHVDSCGLEPTSTGEQRYYILCEMSYAVGSERTVTTIHSTNAPSREVWQYPRNQIAPLERWIEAHPTGTPIVLRYNPAKHREVVSGDTLVGGPHTPGNIKLLEFCAGSFAVLLMILRLTRARLQTARPSIFQ